jgi:hypothetical protein
MSGKFVMITCTMCGKLEYRAANVKMCFECALEKRRADAARSTRNSNLLKELAR